MIIVEGCCEHKTQGKVFAILLRSNAFGVPVPLIFEHPFAFRHVECLLVQNLDITRLILGTRLVREHLRAIGMLTKPFTQKRHQIQPSYIFYIEMRLDCILQVVSMHLLPL
jgi:hypothetical protein